ncbi:HipA domain-containing protein [Virgibacillus dakarensis]|uniref:HipA domain-containing protein n=1 Tax=Virgibacillus dakarensis TaxID=1917889 RepID=UPI000B442CA2|nr:HipA domain-containing protein [Virgibacillus dakarensis]MBT2217577.1 HipA domain-containing protein [Virgibacillus dakarensis]
MKDVSEWIFTGYGENSTLEKLELLSPDQVPYIIKFPRHFDGKRTNWEDVNEVIAAEIAKILEIKVVDAEIAYRDGRRGCLMKHFRYQWGAEYGETASSLLSAEFEDEFDDLQNSNLKNEQLMYKFFSLFKEFSLFHFFKKDFVFMNLFDILIGNQDRHAHNWQVLYIDDKPIFGPLYDNGASLGWQLSR